MPCILGSPVERKEQRNEQTRFSWSQFPHLRNGVTDSSLNRVASRIRSHEVNELGRWQNCLQLFAEPLACMLALCQVTLHFVPWRCGLSPPPPAPCIWPGVVTCSGPKNVLKWRCPGSAPDIRRLGSSLSTWDPRTATGGGPGTSPWTRDMPVQQQQQSPRGGGQPSQTSQAHPCPLPPASRRVSGRSRAGQPALVPSRGRLCSRPLRVGRALPPRADGQSRQKCPNKLAFSESHSLVPSHGRQQGKIHHERSRALLIIEWEAWWRIAAIPGWIRGWRLPRSLNGSGRRQTRSPLSVQTLREDKGNLTYQRHS